MLLATFYPKGTRYDRGHTVEFHMRNPTRSPLTPHIPDDIRDNIKRIVNTSEYPLFLQGNTLDWILIEFWTNNQEAVDSIIAIIEETFNITVQTHKGETNNERR